MDTTVQVSRAQLSCDHTLIFGSFCEWGGHILGSLHEGSCHSGSMLSAPAFWKLPYVQPRFPWQFSLEDFGAGDNLQLALRAPTDNCNSVKILTLDPDVEHAVLKHGCGVIVNW